MTTEEQFRRATFTRGAVALAFLPAIVGFFGLFAPNTRGLWIGGLCALPLLLIWPWARLTMRHSLSRARMMGVFPSAILGTSLAFFLLPLAYLDVTDPTLWSVWLVQCLSATVGWSAGVYQFDQEAQQRVIDRRFRVIGSEITERLNVEPNTGMSGDRASPILNWTIKIGALTYTALVLVGMVLGGGAPLVILVILEPLIGSDQAMGLHAWAMTGLGFVALPPSWYIMPALLGHWRAIRRIEASAGPNPSWKTLSR